MAPALWVWEYISARNCCFQIWHPLHAPMINGSTAVVQEVWWMWLVTLCPEVGKGGLRRAISSVETCVRKEVSVTSSQGWT